MAKIIDRFGNPIDAGEITEPQTSRLASLHNTYANHPVRGLTPPKLASILEAAERGDLVAQSDLFEDFEEKDAHIFSEMQKRKGAALTLPWDIVPPANPSAQEKKWTEQVKEMMQAIDNLDTVMFDTLDGIGKGFSCVEIEWRIDGKTIVPAAFEWRPQSWFMVNQAKQNELRLRDDTAFGAALRPFGWIEHKPKSKSGYVARAGLHRVLSWPFLFKNYSVRDLAEFLEIYGLPLRLGKYPSGASETEKATLLRAVVGIGHNAAGIVPEGMTIEFQEAAKGTHDPFQAMLDWCERSESKAILGQTLSAESQATGLGSGVADMHNEVRRDLRTSDARQLQATLSRDLVYPLAALNVPGVDPRRAPRLVFDLGETEDIAVYSEALPKLVGIKMRIPESWAHEKLGIPIPAEGEAVLESSAPQAAEFPPFAAARAGNPAPVTRATAIVDAQIARVATDADPVIQGLVDKIEQALAGAQSLEEFRDRLLDLFPDIDPAGFAQVMTTAMVAAQLAGRFDISEQARGG